MVALIVGGSGYQVDGNSIEVYSPNGGCSLQLGVIPFTYSPFILGFINGKLILCSSNDNKFVWFSFKINFLFGSGYWIFIFYIHNHQPTHTIYRRVLFVKTIFVKWVITLMSNVFPLDVLNWIWQRPRGLHSPQWPTNIATYLQVSVYEDKVINLNLEKLNKKYITWV